jgi:trehalose 6-phosphate synthase/phosphatase
LSPVSQTNSVNLESIRSNDVANSQNGKEGYVPDSEMFQSNRSSSGQAAVTPSLISMNSSNANDSFSSVSRPGSSLNAVPRLNWKFTKRNDHSALYSGVLSLRGQNKCFYIGVVDKIYTKEGMVISVSNLSADIKSSLTKTLLEEHNALPVFLNRDVSFGHYEGFCKTALWPILHYILWKPSDGKNETKYWQSYNEVNSIFCRAIESQYKTGDVIWVHDYHFLTLPSMLRRALPDAVIGFFLHTPFPSSEIFRCIPQREKLLLGLLGSNMVGFQTYAYARHFISACTRILGVESNPKGIEYRGGHVVIATFPIGIDVKQVEEYRSNPAVTEKIKSIRELYANKKIIIGKFRISQKLNP